MNARFQNADQKKNRVFLGKMDLKILTRRLLLASAVLAISLTTLSPLSAQIRYTPESPEVFRAATRGVNMLKGARQTGIGQGQLAAIAIVEYTKRYENRVPIDDPFIQEQVNTTLKQVAGGQLIDNRSTYATALGAILLLEVDDRRYQNEINQLLDSLYTLQLDNGGFGYRGAKNVGDSSQIQYGGLAYWVAKQHGYNIPVQRASNALEWLARNQQPAGSWFYHTRDGRAAGQGGFRLSLHCAGLSTMYLLADHLQLFGSGRSRGGKKIGGLDLPKSVSVHIEAKDGQERKEGPLVNFDKGLFQSAARNGNQYLKSNWTIEPKKYTHYYLYALERYAFFREEAEGRLPEFPDWYDQGVDFLLSSQLDGGGWEGPDTNALVNTAFSVMFLVRASQVLVLDANRGTVNGGMGFAENKKLIFDKGKVRSREAIKGVQDVMTLLEEGIDEADTDFILETLGPAISQMASKEGKSRNEHRAFMRGLIGDKDQLKRRIAVRLLAGQQTIENAPALLFALGDPDLEICREAHNGLRLISRKIDTFELPERAGRADFDRLKAQWTDWYLGVNPGAELLD